MVIEGSSLNKDPAFCFIELHEVCISPRLKCVQVPLDGIPPLQCVDCTTQLGGISELAEGALFMLPTKMLNLSTGPSTNARGRYSSLDNDLSILLSELSDR